MFEPFWTVVFIFLLAANHWSQYVVWKKICQRDGWGSQLHTDYTLWSKGPAICWCLGRKVWSPYVGLVALPLVMGGYYTLSSIGGRDFSHISSDEPVESCIHWLRNLLPWQWPKQFYRELQCMLRKSLLVWWMKWLSGKCHTVVMRGCRRPSQLFRWNY